MQIRRVARALYRLYPKTVVTLSSALLLTLFALPLFLSAPCSRHCASAPAGELSLVTDRVWFDRYPDDPHDNISVWLLLTEGVGVYQEGSAFRATFDVFEHSGQDGELDLRFLHDGEEAHSHFVATECDEQPPFDLCLTVENPARGSTRYYGFSDDYEGESHRELAPHLDAAWRTALAPHQ